MQAALEGVEGVTEVEVGAIKNQKATTMVKAGSSVEVSEMIAALKIAGYGASESEG